MLGRSRGSMLGRSKGSMLGRSKGSMRRMEVGSHSESRSEGTGTGGWLNFLRVMFKKFQRSSRISGGELGREVWKMKDFF